MTRSVRSDSVLTHRIVAIAVFLLVALMALPGTALAHHGFGTYDLSKDIRLIGTIARVDLINPHAFLHVTVTTPGRAPVTWECEMRGATVLRRSGWTPELLPVGSQITVEAAPDRANPHRCYVNSLILANGTRLDRYTQRPVSTPVRPVTAPQHVDGPPDISGDWAAEQQVMTDPRGLRGVLVPLSAAAHMAPGSIPRDRAMGISERDVSPLAEVFGLYRVIVGAATLYVSPWTRATVELTPAGRAAARAIGTPAPCQFTSILWDWLIETTVNQITQTPGAIILRYGQFGVTRTIHLDTARHPDSLTPSRVGHSIGRWEGQVLVVDTVGFTPGILGEAPHSARLHVIERFTIDPEGRTLRRDYVADDREFFAQPYRGSDTMLRSNVPYAVDRCDDRFFSARGTK